MDFINSATELKISSSTIHIFCLFKLFLKINHYFLSFMRGLGALQRFNVAITRARSLLIVVGNPVILSKDPTWAK